MNCALCGWSQDHKRAMAQFKALRGEGPNGEFLGASPHHPPPPTLTPPPFTSLSRPCPSHPSFIPLYLKENRRVLISRSFHEMSVK